MKKLTLICFILILAQLVMTASASTDTYMFVPGLSTVVQTGGFAGVHETYSIKGYFQMTVDFDDGTASFDWVDATLSDSPFLETTSLGELFNMTELTGSVINNTTIEFVGKTQDGFNADITLTVTVLGNSLHLIGTIISPCCDLFNYNLNAMANEVPADWTYRYFDDFSTDKAEDDSYTHSIFWPQGAFPPPEPYLYYCDHGPDRALAFIGYQGQPAHLGYCFPIQPGPSQRAIKGTIGIDVAFPSNIEMSQSPPGYLLYSVSDDGSDWSVPIYLGPGHHNILLSSMQGTCYVIFLGTKAVIDNIEVSLYSPQSTIRVPSDYNTIQDAIDAAIDGDVIFVEPGVYRGRGNRDIEFHGKAIFLYGAGPDNTIIDCSSGPADTNPSGRGHRGFYFHESEKSDSVVCGFTIKGGIIHGSEIPADNMRWNLSPAHPVGGGIYCEFSSPTIINCVITGCGAEVGGGIGCVGSNASIVDCTIMECTAGGFGTSRSGGRGGGIGLIRGCDAKITHCIIANNSGYYNSYGAGLYCQQSCAVVKGCDISHNHAPGNIEGGGLYCAGYSSRLLLQNCVISHNSAYAGSGIFTELDSNIANNSESEQGEALHWIEPASGGSSLRCYVRITNCTIAHNYLTGPEMLPYPGGGIHSIKTDIIVKNSIVWYNNGTQVLIINPASNSPVIYSNVQGGYLGQGNINAEPLFAPAEGGLDPVQGYALPGVPDYHLQSVYGRYDPVAGTWVIDRNHSPCIDAGDPKDAVGAEPLPNGKRINMGAYGGTRQASKGAAHLVYHVDGINGNDSNSGLSKAQAFETIQRAINATRDGDTVLVWPAVYRQEINFDGKAITVQSAADAAIVTASRGYAFSFFRGEDSNSILRNFVITDSEYGIFCNGASPTITNLTIVNNQFGIAAYDGANPKITNCILWDNISGDLFQCYATYSCIQEQGHDNGQGNISEDPLFADPSSGDYHLRSRFGRYWPRHNVWVIDNVTSPCIDTGDPNMSPETERMPHGGRVNIGAYGGTAYASMSTWPLKGDVNHDGVVDLEDFALMAEDWLQSLPDRPRQLQEIEIELPVDGAVVPVSAKDIVTEAYTLYKPNQ